MDEKQAETTVTEKTVKKTNPVRLRVTTYGSGTVWQGEVTSLTSGQRLYVGKANRDRQAAYDDAHAWAAERPHDEIVCGDEPYPKKKPAASQPAPVAAESTPAD